MGQPLPLERGRCWDEHTTCWGSHAKSLARVPTMFRASSCDSTALLACSSANPHSLDEHLRLRLNSVASWSALLLSSCTR